MLLLITIIVLALLFDYINGFHDAANSIATIVATKVLTPFQAVLWAAFFNFLSLLGFWIWCCRYGCQNSTYSSIDLSCNISRNYRSHYLEFIYLVERNSIIIITYFNWWFCWSSNCSRIIECYRPRTCGI
jgi:hypothetical protein